MVDVSTLTRGIIDAGSLPLNRSKGIPMACL